MREGFGPTPIIGTSQHAIDRLGVKNTVQVNKLIKCTFQPTFTAGPVIAHDIDEKGVIKFIDLIDGIDQTTDLDIRVLGKSSKRLHL